MRTKKLTIAILIVGITLFATSCGKDKKEEPTIKNTFTLSGKIESSVNLEGQSIEAITEGGKEGKTEKLGSSVVKKNGEFTLELKTPILLHKLEVEGNINNSNKDVKVSAIDGLSIKGEKEGMIELVLHPKNTTTNKDAIELILFLYADGNTKLKGTEVADAIKSIYDLNIQKGWNIIKFKQTEEKTVQYTTIPSIPTTNYRWIYDSDSTEANQ